MKFEALAEDVRLWAHEKGIFDYSEVLKQLGKTAEELQELEAAIREWEIIDWNTQERPPMSSIEEAGEAFDEVMLEMGDVLVTLIIAAEFLSVDLEDCLEMAYNKISKRKGEMRDGVFVKQEDLPTTKEENCNAG